MTKGSKKKIYKLQQDIVVWYNDSAGKKHKVTGRLLKVYQNEIVLSSLKRRNLNEQRIAINSIYAINKARIRDKKNLKIGGIIYIVATLLGLLLLVNANPLAGAWLGVLVFIPLVGFAWGLLLGGLVLVIQQLVSKKWIDKNGWTISAG